MGSIVTSPQFLRCSPTQACGRSLQGVENPTMSSLDRVFGGECVDELRAHAAIVARALSRDFVRRIVSAQWALDGLDEYEKEKSNHCQHGSKVLRIDVTYRSVQNLCATDGDRKVASGCAVWNHRAAY